MKYLLILLFASCVGNPKPAKVVKVKHHDDFIYIARGRFEEKNADEKVIRGKLYTGHVIHKKKRKKANMAPPLSFGVQPDVSFLGIGGNMVMDTAPVVRIDTTQFNSICAKSMAGPHKNCEHSRRLEWLRD